MRKSLIWVIACIAIIAVAGLSWFFLLRDGGAALLSIFSPGLEGRGSLHLVLRVVTDDAVSQELLQDAEKTANELHSRGIAFAGSKKGSADGFAVTDIDPARTDEARSLGDQMYQGKYSVRSTVMEGKTCLSFTLLPAFVRVMRESAVKQTQEAILRRLNALGISRPKVQINDIGSKDVQDQLVVEIPGVDDTDRIKTLITDMARLDLKLVKQDTGGPYSGAEQAVQANGGKVPEGYDILPFRAERSEGNTLEYMVVRTESVITSRHLKNARPSTGADGAPAVSFFLTTEGGDLFSRFTERHVGDRLAIVLNNVIYSAPVIEGKIGAEGVISGQFTGQQAEDLALLLRSGTLPASLIVLEERRIGGPQGADSTSPDKK
jgi:preprotein translocase subunit SecD